MENYIKKIMDKYREGYTQQEIFKDMQLELKEFSTDEEKVKYMITVTCEKTRAAMTDAEKDAMEKIRQNRKEMLQLEKEARVLNLVKNKAEELRTKCKSTKEALAAAIRYTADKEGMSDTTVRDYVKRLDLEFYQFYSKNLERNNEFYEAMALGIIENRTYKSDAKKFPGYEKMIEYTKSNRPDLYEQIKEVYASHSLESRNIKEAPKNYKVFNNIEYFIKIILEYRMTLDELYEFVKETGTTYCDLSIQSKEDLIYALYNKVYASNYVHAIRWYLTETMAPDDFTEYRSSRFKAFKEQYFSLKSLEEQKRFILTSTSINLNSIKEKAGEHLAKQSYNFTLDEIRALVRWGYNYALSTESLTKDIFEHRIDKAVLIAPLKESNELYDRMLVYGWENLNEYHKDVAAAQGFKRY